MFTLSELKLLENYRKLDSYGKDLVDTVISKELKRTEETNKKTTKSNDEDIVYINFAQNTACLLYTSISSNLTLFLFFTL